MSYVKFEPIKGRVYTNTNGVDYICTNVHYDKYGRYENKATFVSKSGWRFIAVDIVIFNDGKIEWGHSFDGYFLSEKETTETFKRSCETIKLQGYINQLKKMETV